MTTQDQRAAFEAWAKWFATPVRYIEAESQYANMTTEIAYQAWQAAIEHDRQQSGEPVAWRIRHRSEPGMIGHYPWSYTDRIRGGRDDMHYEYEPLFATPQPTAPTPPNRQDPS